MNTKQLITLWYGALFVLILMLAGERSTVTLTVAGAVVLLLLIYSLSGKHRASKHKVMLAVFLPMCLVGIGSFVLEGSTYDPSGYIPANPTTLLPEQSVSLQGTQFHHRFFMDRFSGQIKNNSNQTLNTVVIRFTLAHASGKTEDMIVTLKGFSIPPGQTGPFSQTLLGLHPRAKGAWKWSARVLDAVGT